MKSAVDISRGLSKELRLGNLQIARDWGWAPEYVEAMRRMLQADRPEDFVIATGASATLSHFVERAFSRLGMDYKSFVKSDADLKRPLDLSYSLGDPSAIRNRLGWSAGVMMPELVDLLIDAELVR